MVSIWILADFRIHHRPFDLFSLLCFFFNIGLKSINTFVGFASKIGVIGNGVMRDSHGKMPVPLLAGGTPGLPGAIQPLGEERFLP